jgi:hypothetical protein
MDTAAEARRTSEPRRCGFKLPQGTAASSLSRFIAAPLSAAPSATLRGIGQTTLTVGYGTNGKKVCTK